MLGAYLAQGKGGVQSRIFRKFEIYMVDGIPNISKKVLVIERLINEDRGRRWHAYLQHFLFLIDGVYKSGLKYKGVATLVENGMSILKLLSKFEISLNMNTKHIPLPFYFVMTVWWMGTELTSHLSFAQKGRSCRGGFLSESCCAIIKMGL